MIAGLDPTDEQLQQTSESVRKFILELKPKRAHNIGAVLSGLDALADTEQWDKLYAAFFEARATKLYRIPTAEWLCRRFPTADNAKENPFILKMAERFRDYTEPTPLMASLQSLGRQDLLDLMWKPKKPFSVYPI